MKGLYHSEITVNGPARLSQVLPFPSTAAPKGTNGLPVYYKEIAVLAFPQTTDHVIRDPAAVISLSEKMDRDGRLSWDVPAGLWVIARFITSNTGQKLMVPCPNSNGLIIDHLDGNAARSHFRYIIDQILKVRPSLDALRYMEVDGVEVDNQTAWTDSFVAELRKRRGYDPVPYLPLLKGKSFAEPQQFKDVITGLHLERMLDTSGPTGGHVVRPSDGKEPKNVVFLQCVGSRDESKGVAYCSRICCMYTAKQAILLKDHFPQTQSYIFYIDIRAAGKGYEEFVKRAQREYGAIYIRGRVSKIYEEDNKLIVRGIDTLTGKQVEIEADLVVLATAVVPQPDAIELAKILNIPYDQYGFYSEAHPKLQPVESLTKGIFLTGSCQFPKDIPDSVATTGAASVRACEILSKDELVLDPKIACVSSDICSGCLNCVEVCPSG